MSDSDHDKRKDAVVEYLSDRQANLPLRVLGAPPTREEMQHDLARNLLVGFLVLFIIVLLAVYKFDSRFCSNAKACGENFVNIKVIIDALFNFGSPFIGIIIGFFFSEKFWNNKKDDE